MGPAPLINGPCSSISFGSLFFFQLGWWFPLLRSISTIAIVSFPYPMQPCRLQFKIHTGLPVSVMCLWTKCFWRSVGEGTGGRPCWASRHHGLMAVCA